MSILSRLMAWVSKLPPAETHDVAVERNLAIELPDGVVLRADHYSPRNLGARPTVLVRSTYTDRTKAGWTSEMIAERGFHVLVVSGRGVDGSSGELTPFLKEREDGRAVVAWLKRQPWFNGVLGTTGASYLGYTQWAIARDAQPLLKAMSTQLIGSNLRDLVYPGGAFALDLFVWWMLMVDSQERSVLTLLRNAISSTARRQKLVRHLPLVELDRVATGKRYAFWRDWLAHEAADDPWWLSGDHSHTVGEVAAPNHLISGWYDFFLPQLMRDYAALREAGHQPYLTIGPWTHFDGAASLAGAREGIIWLRAHLLDDGRLLRAAPVRVFVLGANEWRDLPAWPPETPPQR